MRQITIDYTNPIPCEKNVAGRIGEHNATELIITPPEFLSANEKISHYVIAFAFDCKVIHSESIPKTDELKISLWNQLTQSEHLTVQLEGYDSKGDYIGKSEPVRLRFLQSVCGEEIPADTDNPDLISDFLKNKHTHSNMDALDNFSEDEEGNPLYNGKPIGGGQVLSSDVFYDNPELQDSTNSVKGALDEAIDYVLHGIPEIYLEKSNLDNAIDKALKEAQKSGEFDGEDYVLTDADKAEIADMTKPKLTMVEMMSDYDTGFVHDHVAKTITIECASLPINARVRRIEIPDVVNETDEYFNLEDMMVKDTVYRQNAPYIITYPKNMQGEHFTVAACVYFPSESNRFFDAVSTQLFFDKTIKIYYEIEEQDYDNQN